MTIQQRTLFDDLTDDAPNTLPDLSAIVGLKYIRDFINEEKHADLLRQVDSQPWLNDLKRGSALRVQVRLQVSAR